MNVWQRVQCVFGAHVRDRKRAYFDGEQFRSMCSGCGKPMIKARSGWILDVAEGGTNGNRADASID